MDVAADHVLDGGIFMETIKESKSDHVPSAILELIGKLYDAALNPSLWPNALGALAKYYDASHAVLMDENFKVMTSQVFLGSKSIAAEFRHYNKSVIFTSPLRVPAVMTKMVGEIFCPTDLLSPAEYVATRYYQTYIQPNGWGDAILAILNKTDEKLDLFCITRMDTKPMYNADERAELQMLMPHIQRAFQINRALEKKNSEISDLRAAVDEVSTAIFFLDSNAHVAHMNAAARKLLIRNDILSIELDQLKTINAKSQKLFENALDLNAADHAQEFLFPSTTGDDYIFRVLPLSKEHTRASVDGRASAMLFVKRAEIVPSSSIELIAERYHLTPREMNVLVAIVEAGGVPDASAILGLKSGTVRTHLKSVFAKTGLKSQMELAKLVAGYA